MPLHVSGENFSDWHGELDYREHKSGPNKMILLTGCLVLTWLVKFPILFSKRILFGNDLVVINSQCKRKNDFFVAQVRQYSQNFIPAQPYEERLTV